MTSDPVDYEGSEGDRTASILDVLGDSVAREILRLGKDQVMTVEALAEQCDVSEATVYRRLRQLHDLKLVEKCARFEAGAVTQGAYRTTMDRLSVQVDADGVTVDTTPRDGLAEAVETVRRAVDVNAVSYHPSDNSVEVSFRFDGDDEQIKTYFGRYLK